jgi:antitoxin component YwqK of YwqJK toxin-antitoxin module
MRKHLFSLPIAATLLLAGCGSDDQNQVISKRYIHKYGYAVSKEEWGANKYPGQVITNLRSGVTITATYENGTLHGPCTHTHPHSQTVQYYYQYNQGNLIKEIAYDSMGMPMKEKVQLSPQRFCITQWYADGTPMSVEDFAGEELLAGEYFSLHNEIESKVERGIGLRTKRNQQGTLLSKDKFDAGYMVMRESYYPTGTPESITHYTMNKIHGERQAFNERGEPLAQEEYVNDSLHGKATYFLNGRKQAEVFFLNGLKNGLETHYIDGDAVEEEILWYNDRQHGPTKFYVDGVAKVDWYYDGKKVSKKRYEELEQLDQMISQASQGFRDGGSAR